MLFVVHVKTIFVHMCFSVWFMMFLLLMLKNNVFFYFYSSSNWGYTMQDLWRQILWDSLWRYYMWRVQGENSAVIPYWFNIFFFSYTRCALYRVHFNPRKQNDHFVLCPSSFIPMFSGWVYITPCSSCGGRAHLWKPHLILAILYTDVTLFLFCRGFSDAASRTMPCTRVHGRGTAWSTEPTGTAANTVACRSAWRSAWAVMVSASLAHQLTENCILEIRTQIKVLHEERQGQRAAEGDFMQQFRFLQLFGFIQSRLDWLDDHDVKMWSIWAWFHFKFKYLRYV